MATDVSFSFIFRTAIYDWNNETKNTTPYTHTPYSINYSKFRHETAMFCWMWLDGFLPKRILCLLLIYSAFLASVYNLILCKHNLKAKIQIYEQKLLSKVMQVKISVYEQVSVSLLLASSLVVSLLSVLLLLFRLSRSFSSFCRTCFVCSIKFRDSPTIGLAFIVSVKMNRSSFSTEIVSNPNLNALWPSDNDSWTMTILCSVPFSTHSDLTLVF